MTQKKKAKAYDEALEIARKELLACGSTDCDAARQIFRLFPELNESKDERIRKVIIGLLKQSTYEDCYYDGINMRDIYEYLEKQCGQKPICKMQVSEKLYEHIKNTCNCIDDALSSETFADITDYLEMASKDAQDAFDMIEKQGEQKPIPKFKIGDTMRTLQEANDGYTDGMPVVVSIDNEYYHCTNELIAIKDQEDYEFPPINVKQNLVNKIESKFKVGDYEALRTEYEKGRADVLRCIDPDEMVADFCSQPLSKTRSIASIYRQGITDILKRINNNEKTSITSTRSIDDGGVR